MEREGKEGKKALDGRKLNENVFKYYMKKKNTFHPP